MPAPSLTFSRQSHNLASYGERGRHERDPGYLWASVLHNSFTRDPESGMMVLAPLPTYSFTLYRFGEGEVGRFVYKPKSKPQTERLSDRTVTRLVRDYLRREREAER